MSADVFAAAAGPARREQAAPRQAGVRLLEAIPEMERGVPADQREFARRSVVAPVASLNPGPLSLARDEPAGRRFGWIVLDGIILRRTWLGDRPTAELLGEGDIIDIHSGDDAWSLESRTEYAVHRAATVAVLDDRFRLAARHWPGLHDVLTEQRAAQTRRASRQLAAALGLPRVEDRLAALFSDLADRWGRVTPEGVTIDLELTHSLLGELVGSRRPTVSLALSWLAANGTVTRRADRTWLVSPSSAAVALCPAGSHG